jgi:arginyl-tRNA synthetase
MIKTEIEKILQKAIIQSQNITLSNIEIFPPENEKFGHYSTNVALKLARTLSKNPLQIAEEITKTIQNLQSQKTKNSPINKLEIAKPGFINIWLQEQRIIQEIKKILKETDNYGKISPAKKQTIIIDFSAPNIAKPMHVGHLRSTLIGQALYNILCFQGYKVISDNHIGDWGTQFGALITAWKQWGDKKLFKKNPIDHLVNLYIRFHKEAAKNSNLLNKARKETKKLQEGNKQNTILWKQFTKASLQEFEKIYKRLNIKFNYILGESFYQPLLKTIVADALQKGIAQKQDGAVKIFFTKELPPLVIQKTDGSYLYSTTDLAAIKYRMQKWHPTKILYVVANEQSLHFEQIFEAAIQLGYAQSNNLEHLKFGLVLGESGKKTSTRHGNFIKLEELLDKAVNEANKINPQVAEAVGIGAIKWRILSQERNKDIIFDWQIMLNLKGNSAPYLQYTYARLNKILKKSPPLSKIPNLSILQKEIEKSIMRQLIYFKDVLNRVVQLRETNILADYLIKLANLLNNFYEHQPILTAPQNMKNSRLHLIKAATNIIKNSLKLLGIKTPQRL